MKKYCYSKDIVLTKEQLLKEMDCSIFFDPKINQKNEELLEKLLNSLGIHLENFDYQNNQITIRTGINRMNLWQLQNISNRYYDQSDNLYSLFSIVCPHETLLSLEGEIYESLNLEEDEICPFCEEHGYADLIFKETKSLLHFRGVEYNSQAQLEYEQMLETMQGKNLTLKEQQILDNEKEKIKEIKDVYITKDNQMFYFYYNSPHIFNRLSKDDSLSALEIATIQNRITALLSLNGKRRQEGAYRRIETTNDNSQFLEYVDQYLTQYRKVVENKGYTELTPEIVDPLSLQFMHNCIQGTYPNGIFCKITIISDNPIQTNEEKNHQFLKEIKHYL